jgi:glucose/arabinose dehydrogenase
MFCVKRTVAIESTILATKDFAPQLPRIQSAETFLGSSKNYDANNLHFCCFTPVQQTAGTLGNGPWNYTTSERNTRIRVSVVTKGLSHPWSMAWLPDGSMLVTERQGRLRIIRNGVLDPQPITGVPQVQAGGTSGLLDVALHPKFATNNLVYLAYNKQKQITKQDGKPGPVYTTALARGRLEGNALVDVKELS